MDIYAVANQMRMERKTIFDLPMRVTYYGRVSTTREEQENSIEHQMSYFSEMIQNNPNGRKAIDMISVFRYSFPSHIVTFYRSSFNSSFV